MSIFKKNEENMGIENRKERDLCDLYLILGLLENP